MLRDLLADDEELRRFRDEARRRQLPAVVRLPSPLSPAAFTEDALQRLPERTPWPTWHGGISHPWRAWIARNIERRIAEILIALFDELRAGTLVATGRPLSNPIDVVGIPSDVWSSIATAIETATGNVSIGGAPAFVDVAVQQPAPPLRSASRASLDKFITRFDAGVLALGRRYSTAELVAVTQQHLGAGVSASEIEGALRRASLGARAGGGRRPAHVVPSEAELAQAARQAVGTCP